MITNDEMTSVTLGVDVGGTKVLACAASAVGEVLAQAELASPGEATELLDVITDLLVDLASAFDLTKCRVDGLGIAIPGLINQAGVLGAAPNLDAPNVDIDLRAQLVTPLRSSLEGIGIALADDEVVLDNDGTCAALAEFVCGAAQGVEDAIVISLGTGIGGGIITNGQLVRGSRHYAGEVGHVVVEAGGAPCPCGRHGCWERYASGGGLARLAQVRLVGRDSTLPDSAMVRLAGGAVHSIRGEHVVAAARLGDSAALETLTEFSRWLALGLVNLSEVFDPALIVLGGGLIATSDMWLDQTRREVIAQSRRATLNNESNIVEAALGRRAAVIGAALVGRGVRAAR